MSLQNTFKRTVTVTCLRVKTVSDLVTKEKAYEVLISVDGDLGLLRLRCSDYPEGFTPGEDYTMDLYLSGTATITVPRLRVASK